MSGTLEERATYYTTERLMDLWESAERGTAEEKLYNDAHSASLVVDGGEVPFLVTRENHAKLVAEHRAALMALPWPPPGQAEATK
jgi:hypothetical protein